MSLQEHRAVCPPNTPVARALARAIEVPHSGCWVFPYNVNNCGYGRIQVGGRKSRVVHRVVYEHFVGSVPAGLQLDHLCRVRNCCNPAHLEPVTCQENLRRSPLMTAKQNAAKTHCAQGHEYTHLNTRITACGWRKCRACDAAARRKKTGFKPRGPNKKYRP